MFRGLSSTLIRSGTLLFSIKALNDLNFNSNKYVSLGIISSILSAIYVLIYPIEIIKIRMTAEIER